MKQSLQIWLEAARPKTLPLALVSILTGSVLAYSAGHFSLTIAIMAFVTATLLQILSNLANDYAMPFKVQITTNASAHYERCSLAR